MLKYKVEYESLSVAEYEKRYLEQQLKYLEKKAAKFGLQPCAESVEASSPPSGVFEK